MSEKNSLSNKTIFQGEIRSWEMVQLLRCLPHKPETWVRIPIIHKKSQGHGSVHLQSQDQRQKQADPWNSLTSQPDQICAMEVQWKITSQEISWEVIENTTNVKLWPPLSSPLAHMQTYLHVQAHTYTREIMKEKLRHSLQTTVEKLSLEYLAYTKYQRETLSDKVTCLPVPPSRTCIEVIHQHTLL